VCKTVQNIYDEKKKEINKKLKIKTGKKLETLQLCAAVDW
jgi:hypothetical protein